jgi:hypothetical protein
MGDGIGPLMDRIRAAADGTGAWAMSSDETIRALGMDTVAFWRGVHAVRDRISFGDAVDGWSHDTVGELVTVLEELGFRDAEASLARAGIFLPREAAAELMEELAFRAQLLSAAHAVREEELAAMLRHTGNVSAAMEIYLGEYVDLDALVDECAESFRALHGLPQAGRALCARFLRAMFARHILDTRGMLAGLAERLRLEAARLGWVDLETGGRSRDGRGGRGAGEDGGTGGAEAGGGRSAGRREWACRVMGVSRGECTAEDLRRSYRRLMMRHHPDVDPAGLERCKDVNAAYALLMDELASGG